ncbi:MAG: mobile mystery protein A [Bdellovibrionales bacterium]|nr:mobile mystery protein A [Bdellovibrionales bacterium]
MKIRKNDLKKQRQILEKRLVPWLELSGENPPPIGWIKAIRGALGMTTGQLARRLEINQAGVIRYEQREAEGRITLQTLSDVAKAMHCKLVYAIVPDDGFQNLDEVLNHQADVAAEAILRKVSHSMRLEKQEVSGKDKGSQETLLANKLKDNLDSRLWDKK